MGYAGKLQEKAEARRLRKQGLSYQEIRNKIKVSKSTISLWCRDIELTTEQKERLYLNKVKGGLKGRLIGAKKQQEERLKRINDSLVQGMREVGRINNRDLFIAGVMLYTGEGEKKDGYVGISNSDPAVIRFMMRWFREICKVPDSKFQGRVYIHDNLNEPRAQKYWSELTGIPSVQFQKSYIAKNNPNRIRKNIHQYGVFTVRFGDVTLHRKIMGWIQGVLRQN